MFSLVHTCEGYLSQEDDEVDPGQKHSDHAHLPLPLEWTVTRSKEGECKEYGTHKQDDLNPVDKILDVVESGKELDKLEYLKDEANGGKDDDYDGRYKDKSSRCSTGSWMEGKGTGRRVKQDKAT